MEQQFDFRSITSSMRRRARWSQYQAYALLAVTLGIATYAALYFATEDRSVVVNVNLEMARVEEQVSVNVPDKNIFEFSG